MEPIKIDIDNWPKATPEMIDEAVKGAELLSLQIKATKYDKIKECYGQIKSLLEDN